MGMKIRSVFFGLVLGVVSAWGSFAPTEATVLEHLVGQTINSTGFTSTTRFNWNGETGNWSYQKISDNVGLLTQTYDEGANDPGVYREETRLTFNSETSGTFVYTEYLFGSLDFTTSGSFDFPWLAGTSGPPLYTPQSWVNITWPYMFSGVWHYFFTSAESIQYRVDMSTGVWETLDEATGWHFYSWPYSYSVDTQKWYWHFDGYAQWVLNMTTGNWSILGQ